MGVVGQHDASGWAMYAAGNVSQNRANGGWVKAMALVNPFAPAGQNITRCFNSIFPDSRATTPPCGINFVRNAEGRYYLNFGFKLNDRFFSAIAYVDQYEVGIVPVISHKFFDNGTTMRIVTRHNYDDTYAESHFVIVVY